MKLINPKSPSARLAIAGSVIEADARGIVDVEDDDVAASLLNSGYMLLEKHEADSKISAVAAKKNKEKADAASKAAVKAAEDDAKKAAAEAAKLPEVEDEADEEEEGEEDPAASARGWSRKKTSSKK